MRMWRRPLDSDGIRVPGGRIFVIKNRCKGCGFCIEFCPRGVLEFSDEFNVKGYHPPEVAHPERCVNCGLCTLLCPEFAIFSEPDEERDAAPDGESEERGKNDAPVVRRASQTSGKGDGDATGGA